MQDMATEGGSFGTAAAAAYASLQQQVNSLESDFQQSMRRVETSIDSMTKKIEAQSTTPWPTYIGALGVLITIMTAIGYMAYRPIDAGMTAIVAELKDQRLTEKQDVASLRESQVPRVEHEREWRRIETALTETRNRIERNQDALFTKESAASIQRQIDELRKDFGGVVTTRDVLLASDKRLERLEAEFRAMSLRGTVNGAVVPR